MTSMPSRQRGLSLISVVFIGLIAVGTFAIGGQSVPIFLEYQAIRKATGKAINEGSSVAEIRSSFDRAASIDNIESITGKDLEITKAGDRFSAQFEYERDIHLGGPAYLVYRFDGFITPNNR